MLKQYDNGIEVKLVENIKESHVDGKYISGVKKYRVFLNDKPMGVFRLRQSVGYVLADFQVEQIIQNIEGRR